MKSKILFLIIFLISNLLYSNNFEPINYRNAFTGEQKGKVSWEEQRNLKNPKGKVIYGTKLVLSKNRYIQGEPIQYRLYAFPQNNKSFLTRGLKDAQFTIRGENSLNKGVLFKYASLFLFNEIKRNYVILPYPLLKRREMLRKSEYLASDSSNIFYYFPNYPDLQITIKPGKYCVKLELKEVIRDAYRYAKIDQHAYNTTKIEKGDTVIIKPGSTAVYIDTVPDSEKEAFGLYKAGQYKELVSKYPKSVYAAPSYYGILASDIKRAINIRNSNPELREKIKIKFYNMVKNYPDYCSGEGVNTFVILVDYLLEKPNNPENRMFSNTAEMETYFKKFYDLKDNAYSQWFYKDAYRGYVDLLKKVMGRYK
ncbi:hypothetical protein KAU43_05180 [candidate division WOR-3 bacterium]|nr:hypothetical protein [candidate division WOR-3 bacterium]